MKTRTASPFLLLCYFLYDPVVMASDQPPLPPATLMATPGMPQSQNSAWVSAGAGCLGGAALGTVLPGIGNLIGCFVGGASAWWLRSEPAR